MNMAINNGTAPTLPKFDILKHLDKLTPDGGSTSGKDEISYHCPVCGSNNFKIYIDGKSKGKWSTWGCECAKSEAGKQKIKDKLAPLKSEKKVREQSKASFTYREFNGTEWIEVAQVRRYDDGTGKRKFHQYHHDGSKWVAGLPESIWFRIHLYQIEDKINQAAIVAGEDILIVEGEGKVNKLLAMGIPATCSLAGAGKWRTYGYPNYLEDLGKARPVICPDRDQPGIKHGDDIALDFPDAKWLYPSPTSYLWERLIQPNKGFDIADWIDDDGATVDDILNAIGDRRELILSIPKPPEELLTGPPMGTITASNSVVTAPVASRKTNRGMTTLQQDAEMIENEVGHLLTFDTATQNFYLEGKRLTLGRERLLLSTKYGLPIKAGKEDVMDICVQLALGNSFNSVRDYLNKCRNTTGIKLLDICQKLFHNPDPLQAVFLKKWLIAAVARAYEPGCQADEVMILQGPQGQRKSSFFLELSPQKEWVNGNGLQGGKINDEEIRKAQRTWLIEVPEIDKTFKKACASELKAFMTQRGDWLRQLYEKMPELYLRNSVMGGTTNEPEFFTDDTGNRRFTVVKVIIDLIDSLWLRANRDSIWSEARDAYLAGEIWHLTPEEKLLHARQNMQWKVDHPWQGTIEHYLRYETEVTIPEILHVVIKLSLSELKGKSEQMQVSGILKALGFTKTNRRGSYMETNSPIWMRTAENF
jgi:predicted P-loop ATPase